MSDELKAPEEVVLSRLLRLNAMVYGIVSGMVAGLGLFVLTNILILKGGPVVNGDELVGPHLELLGQFFPGYHVTFVGSLVGFVYAFGLAFVIGYGVASVYNLLVNRKQERTAR